MQKRWQPPFFFAMAGHVLGRGSPALQGKAGRARWARQAGGPGGRPAGGEGRRLHRPSPLLIHRNPTPACPLALSHLPTTAGTVWRAREASSARSPDSSCRFPEEADPNQARKPVQPGQVSPARPPHPKAAGWGKPAMHGGTLESRLTRHLLPGGKKGKWKGKNSCWKSGSGAAFGEGAQPLLCPQRKAGHHPHPAPGGEGGREGSSCCALNMVALIPYISCHKPNY